MRLHSGVAPCKEFHTHARIGLQDFSLRGPNQPRIFAGRFEERKNVRAIKPRNATQRSHRRAHLRSEEHTSELQSHLNLVCRLLLEKKKKKKKQHLHYKKKKKQTKTK